MRYTHGILLFFSRVSRSRLLVNETFALHRVAGEIITESISRVIDMGEQPKVSLCSTEFYTISSL